MISFPPASDPLVSIVVVAWQEAPLLMSCLESVRENVADISYEVILVLNEPSPSLLALAQREVSGATVLPFKSNLGFGGGVNAAASKARYRSLRGRL